jgi:manganese/iron transport system permease protein
LRTRRRSETGSTQVALLIDPLQYAFMRTGLIEVLMLGAACGLVGPFVVHRNLTFFGHALSHTILPALVVATVVGVNAPAAALIGALLTVALVYQLQRVRDVGDDSAVGVIFVGLFALGVVLVSWFRVKSPDVAAAVVGNVLGIGTLDLQVTGVLVCALGLAVALVYRPLVLVSFDRLAAEALALPIALLDLVLLTGIAATAVVGVKVVGVILTVALLVTPAAAARQWSAHLPRNLVLSATFIWLAGAIGLYGAYYLPIAPAALIVLVLAVFFCSSVAVGALRRRPRAGATESESSLSQPREQPGR